MSRPNWEKIHICGTKMNIYIWEKKKVGRRGLCQESPFIRRTKQRGYDEGTVILTAITVLAWQAVQWN